MMMMRACVLLLLSLGASTEAFAPSQGMLMAASRTATMAPLAMAGNDDFDFDVAIIGCGVGGHGAALHARAQGLKTAVFAGSDVGG